MRRARATRGRTRLLRLTGAATIAVVASAAEAQLPSPMLKRPTSADTVAPASRVQWQFDQCMAGLSYGAPFKWALSYGMGYVRESTTSDWCVLSAAKVGLGGASLNVGIANSLGHFGSGAALTVGLLRTFEQPLGATANRNYLGASLHLWPLLALGGEVGVYTRLGKGLAGSNRGTNIITWSTGFGF